MDKFRLFEIYSFASSIWSTFKIPGKGTKELDIFNFTWDMLLSPYSMKVIFNAMREYAKESDFCNIVKVEMLCKKYSQMLEGEYIDEEKILKEIRMAINSVNKEKSFKNLQPIAQEVVGGSWQLAKWGMLETGQVDTVVMSNIRKSLHNTIARKNDEMVVEDLKCLEFKFDLLESTTKYLVGD